MEIVYFAALASCFFVAGFFLLGNNAPQVAAVAVFVGALFLFASINEAQNLYAPLQKIEDKTYVVQVKTVDYVGRNIYLLYDLEEEENRVAEFATYPPAGYQEIKDSYGKTFLVPAPKK